MAIINPSAPDDRCTWLLDICGNDEEKLLSVWDFNVIWQEIKIIWASCETVLGAITCGYCG